ncbi:chitinase-3-like protein 1 [Chenopodium quinoa]|uniref:GH18 domain-containing protein n=1 Tax=Chenopodium quinoa TaxID=63459 RepID=A0A803MPV2_CHEQI|nr:chitinase-3-like protein 1 [Chenopodium quinoa]
MAFINNHSSLKIIVSFIVLLSLLHFPFSSAVKGGYWFPDSGLPASNIDSTLFTHLFCAFANLNTQTNQLSVPPECSSSFPRTVRQRNPNVKVLLSIGGGSLPSSNFNNMARQASSRKTFIDSSINLALSNGYDGLDLDWEHQSTVEEMNNLGTLLNEWRATVRAKAPNLILTAALHYSPRPNPVATFPTQAINNNLDFLNVMAYDFYAPAWSPRPYLTRPHASLRDPTSTVSGSSGISAWMQAGVPANKLVLGVPFYGYAWQLSNPNQNGILAPSNGGDTSVGQGTPSYRQIRDFISQRGATVVYNSTYVTNYCYSGTTWIGYDDTQAISTKVTYARNTGLLGYFAWSLGQDQNWALSRQASQTWGSGARVTDPELEWNVLHPFSI